MSRLGLRALLLLLAVPAPAWAETLASPSAGVAGARVLAAVSAVAVLLALTLLGLRWLFQRVDRASGRARLRRVVGGSAGWLSRWMPAAIEPGDRVDIVGRSQVGPKESVCIVRVAKERFLIGVTPNRISLLGRLEAAGEPEAGGDEKRDRAGSDDFALELSGAVAARPRPAESSVRAMLARSRERLAKLGVDSVHAGGGSVHAGGGSVRGGGRRA